MVCKSCNAYCGDYSYCFSCRSKLFRFSCKCGAKITKDFDSCFRCHQKSLKSKCTKCSKKIKGDFKTCYDCSQKQPKIISLNGIAPCSKVNLRQ